ncbi:MAG: YdjY domain-containing protein [Kiritimatiellaeota bacterium]|nr:YdjY domain-containing protein [Kiritimatiellota bacterium]
MRLRLVLLLIMGALPVLAQDRAPYKQQSEGREKNKARVADAYAANLKKYKDDGQALVLPGLVADRKRRRIEIAVESTGLGPDAPCEFMVIGETSGHGYEARLSALAKPSAVHQALRFIGREPGEPYNPDALRFWPKGEPLALTLLRPQQPSIRIEKLIKDQRTGKTLPEAGFLFTGSRMVEQFEHPEKKVYAADEYDPKAIVSLFNSLDAVLQVPYLAPQGAVYANCVINPDVALPEGALMTLVIEPVNPNEARHIKNLVLRVEPGPAAAPRPATDMDRLNSLSVQLQEADTVLNKEPRLRAVLEAITALDRSNGSKQKRLLPDDPFRGRGRTGPSPGAGHAHGHH